MHSRPFRFTRRSVVAGSLALTAALGLGTVGTLSGVFSEDDGIATAQAALPNVVVPPESVTLTPKHSPRGAGSTTTRAGRKKGAASRDSSPFHWGRNTRGDGTDVGSDGRIQRWDVCQGVTTGNGAGVGNGAGKSTGSSAATTPNRYRYGYPMVAFGDSTMALAPTERRTNPFGSCSHYTGTWPLQVSQSLHLPLADLSCSGAKTGAYWQKQLDKYLGSHTKLVVVSYGSNDLRVVYQLLHDNSLPGTGPRFEGKSRQEVEGSLVKILRDVRKRAPNAMILTVGYLPLVQEKQCTNLPNMTRVETTRVRQLRESADIALTNSTKRVAALSEQTWAKQGVKVVTPGIYNVPFRQVHGHDLCSTTSQRFILNKEKKGVRYHYTTQGVGFIADRVVQKYWSEQRGWQRQVRHFTH